MHYAKVENNNTANNEKLLANLKIKIAKFAKTAKKVMANFLYDKNGTAKTVLLIRKMTAIL